MLHLVSGDCALAPFDQSPLRGEVSPWRETLALGPADGSLQTDAWIDSRARFLSAEYNLPYEECRSELVEQHQLLEESLRHDEVVLWFEEDFFCHINLLYLLAWYGFRNTTIPVSFVIAGENKATPDAVGSLTEEQLHSLFEARHRLTRDDLAAATAAWRAYSAGEPEGLRQARSENRGPSFISRALDLHVARFPSVTNGLGSVEQLALGIIDEAPASFKVIFETFSAARPRYGYGDLQVLSELNRLSRGLRPLLTAQGKGMTSRFALTESGRAVMENRLDAIEANGIDQWLGGVHLRHDNLWRWDGSALVRS